MRKGWRYIAIVAVLAAGGLAVGPVWTWRGVRSAERAIAAGDPREQGLALRYLARLKEPRADAVVLAMLASPDAVLRRQATYAIAGAHRLDLAGDVQAAWRREADPATRSEMMYHWAQLVGPAAEPMLREWVSSRDPWMVLAAGRARLRQGDLQAAEMLLSMAAGEGEPAVWRRTRWWGSRGRWRG